MNAKPPNRFDTIIGHISDKIIRAEGKWMDGVFAGLVESGMVPKEVSDWVYSGNDVLRWKAAEWLASRNVIVERHPDGLTRLKMGDTVVGEFKVEFKNHKVSFLQRAPKINKKIMNAKTAKLIRKWAGVRQFNYRRAKRTFLARPAPDRFELRREMKADIARFVARQ